MKIHEKKENKIVKRKKKKDMRVYEKIYSVIIADNNLFANYNYYLFPLIMKIE